MTATKKTIKVAEAKTDVKPTTKTVDSPKVDAVQAAVTVSKEAVELAVKAGNEAATKGYEQAVSVAKEQVEAATEASAEVFKGYEGVIAFHKNNFDAIVEASNIWVTGVQNLNAAWSSFASKSVEQGVSTSKALIACSTVEEIIALNSKNAKSSYDAAVAETQNIREMGIKLAETSAKPLASRVNETVAQFSKPLAA